MGNALETRDAARVQDVASRAAGAWPGYSGAMIVELKRDADGFVTCALHKRGGQRRIDASGHRHDDAVRVCRPGQSETGRTDIRTFIRTRQESV